MAATPNVFARGTIAPATFIALDTATNFGALQATGSTPIIGVSQEGPHDTPGLTGASTQAAYATGQVLQYFGDGEECLVTLGASCTAGDYLVATTGGKAIQFSNTGAGVQYVGGQLLETGISGDKRRMLVRPQEYYHT